MALIMAVGLFLIGVFAVIWGHTAFGTPTDHGSTQWELPSRHNKQ